MKKIYLLCMISLLLFGCSHPSSNNDDKKEIAIPAEVYSKAESLKNQLSKESDFEFKLLNTTKTSDPDVGNVYDIVYQLITDGTIQFRLFYDTESNRLKSICIIMADKNLIDNTNSRYLFNDRLKPAFLKFNFDELFDGDTYIRTKKSDLENDSGGNLYLEYITQEK